MVREAGNAPPTRTASEECAARLSLDHEELMVFRDALQAELTIVLDRRLGLVPDWGS